MMLGVEVMWDGGGGMLGQNPPKPPTNLVVILNHCLVCKIQLTCYIMLSNVNEKCGVILLSRC